ncbi:MAG TPA: cell division protein FtsA [Myxococcales bacterium]|nr:cell division protein FtsA [Myxococcales bacterium]HIN86885.1 cell division protein FtsA [Myxococcales bacterium]
MCCIVGEKTEGGIDIIGIGTAPSKGLRKGVVVNIESTVASIRKAVEEAELMAGCTISNVYVGIAGAHIRGFNSRGIVAVSQNREVVEADIDRVIDAAKAVPMPLDREIIHILPQEYVIDENDGVKEPVGMSGVRLEAKVHIVTAASTSVQNIIRCCNRTGLEVTDVVLEQLASSEATLFEDEKELGVALVDIGGGTTDIAIYYNNAIVHSAVIPIGGNNVSGDIAVGLRTPRAEAEKIKQKFGCGLTSLVGDDEIIEVASVGKRESQTRSRQILCEIIEPRVEEIYMLVQQEIQKSGFEDLITSGVVLTGGGAVMEGMVELAEEVLGLPARIGQPESVGGLVDVVRNPKYSTGVGLVVYGMNHRPLGRDKGVVKSPFWKIWGRTREWFSEVF